MARRPARAWQPWGPVPGATDGDGQGTAVPTPDLPREEDAVGAGVSTNEGLGGNDDVEPCESA